MQQELNHQQRIYLPAVLAFGGAWVYAYCFSMTVSTYVAGFVWFSLMFFCASMGLFGPHFAPRLVRDGYLALTLPCLDLNSLLAQLLRLSETTRRAGLSQMQDLRSNWAPMEDIAQLIAAAASGAEVKRRMQVSLRLNDQRFGRSNRACFGLGVLAVVFWLLLFALPEYQRNPAIEIMVLSIAALCFFTSLRGWLVLANEKTAITLCYRAAEAILQDNSSPHVYRCLSPLLITAQQRQFERLYRQIRLEEMEFEDA